MTSAAGPSLLLAEDDELLGQMISLNLEAEGYQVSWIRDGQLASDAVLQQPFDLLVLDISLPGLDGLSLLRRLRQRELGLPVLMLTVRSDVDTKVEALEGGADDYVTKPFELAELLARVRALLRRSRAERQIPASQLVRIGPYEVNLETREAQSKEGTVVLSEREAALLDLLVRAGGKPLSRHDILDEIWGMDAFPTVRTVDNFLLRLRKLFEVDPRRPRHILTVRGVGYRLDLGER
jgi:DNA-binding response OmpR family regulator